MVKCSLYKLEDLRSSPQNPSKTVRQARERIVTQMLERHKQIPGTSLIGERQISDRPCLKNTR